MAFLNALPIVLLVLVWIGNSSVAAELQFFSQPMNKTVLQGDSVNFSCGIDIEQNYGSTRYRIDWILNYLLLTTSNGVSNVDKHSVSTNTRIKGEVLNIEDVEVTDQGHYYCAVYEDDKFIMYSNKGYLRVIPKPYFSHRFPSPHNWTVIEGREQTFYCSIHSDGVIGSFNLSWFRNDVKLTPGYNFIKPGTYMYADMSRIRPRRGSYDVRIRHFRRSFAGRFHCSVFMGRRQVLQSDPRWIEVFYPPDDIYPRCSPQHLQVYSEEDVLQTTCFSRGGNAPVRLSWIRDGNGFEIPGSSVNSSTIRDEWTLTRRDNGTYISCAMTSDVFSGARVCSIGPIIMYTNQTSMQSFTETMYGTKFADTDEIAAPVVSSKLSDKTKPVNQSHVSPTTYSSLASACQMLHSTTSVAKTTTSVFEVTPNEIVMVRLTCITVVLISLFIVIMVTIMTVCVRGRRTPTSRKTGMNLQVDPESMNECRRDKAMNSNIADKVHYDVSSSAIQI